MRICRVCSSLESEENPFLKKENLCKSCRSLYDKNRDYKTRRKKLDKFRDKEEMRLYQEARRKKLKETDPVGYKFSSANANRKSVEKKKKSDITAYRKSCALIAKRYRNKNKEKYLTYQRNLYHKNPNTHISRLLRSRIRNTLKNNFKSESTFKLLGCSLNFFKEHLQKTALKNGYKDFDINNFNSQKYHLDHIIPCAKFDLSKEDDQKKCFHYSNIQILDTKSNRIKWKY